MTTVIATIAPTPCSKSGAKTVLKSPGNGLSNDSRINISKILPCLTVHVHFLLRPCLRVHPVDKMVKVIRTN